MLSTYCSMLSVLADVFWQLVEFRYHTVSCYQLLVDSFWQPVNVSSHILTDCQYKWSSLTICQILLCQSIQLVKTVRFNLTTCQSLQCGYWHICRVSYYFYIVLKLHVWACFTTWGLSCQIRSYIYTNHALYYYFTFWSYLVYNLLSFLDVDFLIWSCTMSVSWTPSWSLLLWMICDAQIWSIEGAWVYIMHQEAIGTHVGPGWGLRSPNWAYQGVTR